MPASTPVAAITDEATLAAGVEALRSIDPDWVAAVLAVSGPPPLRFREAGFAGLAGIVLAQQVSVASAEAMRARLAAAVCPFEPRPFLAATDEALRACGLSAAKVRTLRAVAAAVDAGHLDFRALATMPAADAHAALCAMPGIGPWTADVFLLFCLGHPDAWPAGDVALQEAARLVLGLANRPDAAALHAIGERWRPYRGVAAQLLWAYYRANKQRAGIAAV